MTHSFSVWAPGATTVEIEVDGARRSMHRQSTGSGPGNAPAHDGRSPANNPAAGDPAEWTGRWSCAVDTASEEPRYSYYVDGEGPFPDPRAPRLPDGVHGPAQRVHHESFSWSDAGFRAVPLAAAVFYELHIGTFAPRATAEGSASGTFDSAAERLADLAELGITHIEIMPVAASSGKRGWGYDGVGLYAPFEAYGGPYGLKRLVNRAHELGMAVCLDCVYNHLGPEGNYLGKFGPYFTDAYNTPWGPAVNFDHEGADEVRAFVLDNLEQWFRDYHVDAVRLDAVHALYDESAVHIVEDMARRARRLEGELGKPLQLIAESNMNNPALVTPAEAGGLGLDAQWSDDFHHCVHTLLTGEEQGYYRGFRSLQALARTLREVFFHAGDYAPARGRHVGRPVGALARSRFIHCSQNHDQVGNRATGERICHLVSMDRARIAAALTVLQPAVPMLFQGEEWAASAPFQFFTDHRDPGLGEAVTRGRCNEFTYFGWKPEDVPDPQAYETFERSMLDWSEREAGGHAEMLSWYRRLLALRAGAPELSASTCTVPDAGVDEPRNALWFRRGRYLVVFRLAQRSGPSSEAQADRPGASADQAQGFELDLEPARCAAVRERTSVSGSGWAFDSSRHLRAADVRASGGRSELLLSCGGATVRGGDTGAGSTVLLAEDSLVVVDLLATSGEA